MRAQGMPLITRTPSADSMDTAFSMWSASASRFQYWATWLENTRSKRSSDQNAPRPHG